MTDDVFEDLVNLYLDKEINPTQLNILKDELGRNSSRLRTFESYCRMHQASHFAALSMSPVIPRLNPSANSSIHSQSTLFGLNRQLFAVAAIVTLIGSFAALYFQGPFGFARIVRNSNANLEKIETFSQAEPTVESLPLEFFRAIKAQNENQNWSYVQELRHARNNSSARRVQEPSAFTWSEQQRTQQEGLVAGDDFEFNYSSYEFKR